MVCVAPRMDAKKPCAHSMIAILGLIVNIIEGGLGWGGGEAYDH